MSMIKRFFKIGQSNANSILDKLEDPIKMTEQGIKDLKRDLEISMRSLAEVKGLYIRAQKDYDSKISNADNYKAKAMQLLTAAEEKKMKKNDANRLAGEAMKKHSEIMAAAEAQKQSVNSQKQNVAGLEQKVNIIKSKVTEFENQLIALRARAKTAESTKKINKQLSGADSSGTIAMLEKMKAKVEEDESLAEAYSDMAQLPTCADSEIDDALAAAGASSASDELDKLKKEMGLN